MLLWGFFEVRPRHCFFWSVGTAHRSIRITSYQLQLRVAVREIRYPKLCKTSRNQETPRPAYFFFYPHSPRP